MICSERNPIESTSLLIPTFKLLGTILKPFEAVFPLLCQNNAEEKEKRQDFIFIFLKCTFDLFFCSLKTLIVYLRNSALMAKIYANIWLMENGTCRRHLRDAPEGLDANGLFVFPTASSRGKWRCGIR